MKRRVFLVGAGASGLVLSAGCPSAAQRIALKDCQFAVSNVRLRRISVFEAVLEVVVSIYNPNDIEVIVDRFDYTLLISGSKAADGRTTRDVSIPRNQTRELPVLVRIRTTDAAQVIMKLRRGGRQRLSLRGTYYVAVPWGRYPFPVQLDTRFRL